MMLLKELPMVLSKKKLTKGEVKRITVQLNNGEIWSADVQDDGTIMLISPISTPPSESNPSEPDEESDENESESEEDDDESEPEGEEEENPKGNPKTGEDDNIMPEGSTKVGEHDRNIDVSSLPSMHEMPEFLKKAMKDPAFRARLSSIMLDNKYDRRLRGRTRGKLDMTRLFKAPTLAKNLFTQKQSRKGKAYNVILLVDESGSMCGGKAAAAAECATFLCHILDGININTCVIGFNQNVMINKDWNDKTNYEELYSAIKTMGEGDKRFQRKSDKRGSYYEYISDPGCNNDYEAMDFAYHHFAKAPTGDNILIMMSDGEPASCADAHYFDSKGERIARLNYTPIVPKLGKEGRDRDSKEVLHQLVESHKDVSSIGIGIMRGGWQIPDYSVVSNIAELKPAIIKALKKTIKRG